MSRRTARVLHSRIRTRSGFGTLYQVRGGPVVEHDFRSNGTLLGGYYVQPEKNGAGEWRNGQRFFGGAALAAPLGETSPESRTLSERFLRSEAPDFNRYRRRLRGSGASEVRPWASAELPTDHRGFRSARLSAGVRRRLSKSASLDTGYVYESRVERVGAACHAVVTSFHFRTPPKYAEPEM